MRNVELKARDPDPDRSLERALALGADDRGEITQRDTYFAAVRGRLKLREQEAGGSPLWDELIGYSRADSSRTGHQQLPARARRRRRSAARRTRFCTWNACDGYKAAKGAALGERAHPPRRGGGTRELCGAGGGRLRPNRTSAASTTTVERVRRELGIEDHDLVAGSYSDLLLGASDYVDACRGRGDEDGLRAVLATSRSAWHCGPRTAGSTWVRTSRTRATRRASAPRPPPSAR